VSWLVPGLPDGFTCHVPAPGDRRSARLPASGRLKGSSSATCAFLAVLAVEWPQVVRHEGANDVVQRSRTASERTSRARSHQPSHRTRQRPASARTHPERPPPARPHRLGRLILRITVQSRFEQSCQRVRTSRTSARASVPGTRSQPTATCDTHSPYVKTRRCGGPWTNRFAARAGDSALQQITLNRP
jgi:hypothetical protein